MEEAIRAPQIMVVDDDQDTVAILARHLQREGFVPIEANSGAQCLKLVQENEVDVILLDLMMPDMDGFQVVRELRANPMTAEIPEKAPEIKEPEYSMAVRSPSSFRVYHALRKYKHPGCCQEHQKY